MAKLRPTFKQIREATILVFGPPGEMRYEADEAMARIDKIESNCIRLIQIQDEVHKLEAEAGYTDQHSGKRHKGIRDDIEREFILLNLFDGVQIEDYVLMPITGSGPDWIDPIELLRLGVPDETIQKATRKGKGWTSVRVQKIKRQEHIGGAKF